MRHACVSARHDHRVTFAEIGPLTTLLEGAAAAVGAGMLLGGFAAGLRGVLVGHPRPVLEGRALEGAYLGGLGGAAMSLADIILRYIF